MLFGRVLCGFNQSGNWAREMSVGNGLEGLGFPDGGTEGDTVVVVEDTEGFGRGCEVIEGAVGVGEVNDVLGDGDIVIAVVADDVPEGATEEEQYEAGKKFAERYCKPGKVASFSLYSSPSVMTDAYAKGLYETSRKILA